MSVLTVPSTIAVIGAGVAGSACASSLQRAGMQVTMFDKARGAGGRMATRRSSWSDASGVGQAAEFDHGAPCFTAETPRFRALMQRALSVGCVARWQPRVHLESLGTVARDGFVAVPTMSSLCRHLLAGVELKWEQPVRRLQRDAMGWQVVVEGGTVHGPYDAVMVALPAAQAALLVAGHQDSWADAMASVKSEVCWTLMAVTDDVDWPWDAAESRRGPLEWVIRNDRKPSRLATPGRATWVAHACAAWSLEHLEDDPATVCDALSKALTSMLPRTGSPLRWHHASVHRWRHALALPQRLGEAECWWDGGLALGVCGDVSGARSVESAWRSGDELADTVLASVEETAT